MADSPSPLDPETTPTEPLGADQLPVPPRPERIGPYRILEELGAGGMGIVFLAEQEEPVRRRVAVKVIRSVFASPEHRLRFEAERRALARLAHPNVAQMLEAGATEEGHPYFVMELVDGEPFLACCDRLQLGIEERLELFLDLCRGVVHAHQRGILHRDLKPSNLLVAELEGRRVPKIIDFGVARGLDDPLVEGAQLTVEKVVGTVDYLAPEAFLALDSETRQDFDVRADLYALGVVLCELLTGFRPFERGTGSVLGQMQRISREEPPSPSARLRALDPALRREAAARRGTDPARLGQRLRGDLDWIVLRAIARQREDRYPGVSELAADVERHLRHEPVEAGPDSPFYRLRKLVRRHLGAVTAGLLLVLALTGGFVAQSREASEARRAREKAEQVSAFLEGLFAAADPDAARGREITVRELLDQGSEAIRHELEDQPLARARVMATMGTVYRRMALLDPAEELLTEALSLRERVLGPSHLLVAATLRDLAAIHWRRGHQPAAEAAMRRVLAIQEEQLGPDDPEVAKSLNNLAILANDQGRYSEAAELYGRSLAIKERQPEPDLLSLAKTRTNLGLVELALGRWQDAEETFRTALAEKEEALPPDHPSLAATHANLAIVFGQTGRWKEAREHHERSLAIKRAALGPEHPDVALDLDDFGVLLLQRGEAEEAIPLLERSRRADRDRGRADAETRRALAEAYLRLGDSGRALPLLHEAETLLQPILPADHPERRQIAARITELAGS